MRSIYNVLLIELLFFGFVFAMEQSQATDKTKIDPSNVYQSKAAVDDNTKKIKKIIKKRNVQKTPFNRDETKQGLLQDQEKFDRIMKGIQKNKKVKEQKEDAQEPKKEENVDPNGSGSSPLPDLDDDLSGELPDQDKSFQPPVNQSSSFIRNSVGFILMSGICFGIYKLYKKYNKKEVKEDEVDGDGDFDVEIEEDNNDIEEKGEIH